MSLLQIDPRGFHGRSIWKVWSCEAGNRRIETRIAGNCGILQVAD